MNSNNKRQKIIYIIIGGVLLILVSSIFFKLGQNSADSNMATISSELDASVNSNSSYMANLCDFPSAIWNEEQISATYELTYRIPINDTCYMIGSKENGTEHTINSVDIETTFDENTLFVAAHIAPKYDYIDYTQALLKEKYTNFPSPDQYNIVSNETGTINGFEDSYFYIYNLNGCDDKDNVVILGYLIPLKNSEYKLAMGCLVENPSTDLLNQCVEYMATTVYTLALDEITEDSKSDEKVSGSLTTDSTNQTETSQPLHGTVPVYLEKSDLIENEPYMENNTLFLAIECQNGFDGSFVLKSPDGLTSYDVVHTTIYENVDAAQLWFEIPNPVSGEYTLELSDIRQAPPTYYFYCEIYE